MRWSAALLVLAALAGAAPASGAEPPAPTAAVPSARTQGIAVLGEGDARTEAFAAARAVYASSARPPRLDEVRARILAGDAPSPAAQKDLKELAELRASVHGDDAASRRLLSAIAEQLKVQGLLVVTKVPTAEEGAEPSVSARLFLAETSEFDAARYEPDATDRPWRSVASSLSRRFPPPAAPPAVATPYVPPPKLASEAKESKPFWASAWFWGALGAAAAVGGLFFLTTQDTSEDPIHLQLRVPR